MRFAFRHRASPRRLLWLVAGFAATGCGLAGTVLPLVPTVPFLLLAAAAFGRSSPRLTGWLERHPRLGPPIRDWRRHRAIGRRAKGLALAAMAAALVAGIVAGLAPLLLGLQVAVMTAAAAFVLTRPATPAETAAQSSR